jgi:hypothetical protein
MTTLKNSKADVRNTRLDMVDQPLILARLTTAQRDALTEIVDGMKILNITTDKEQTRIAGAWVDLN